MVSIQVRLTREQHDALRQCAAESGQSMSDLIREGVDMLLCRREGMRRALAASGKFRSGKKDISAHHDHYLAEAFATIQKA